MIESPFPMVRHRTGVAKRLKVEDATTRIRKAFLVVGQRLRRLNVPRVLAPVYTGTRYTDGIHAPARAAKARREQLAV